MNGKDKILRRQDLEGIPLFDGLEGKLSDCLIVGSKAQLSKGEQCFEEGDTAFLFIVQKGYLQVYRTIENQPIPITDFKAGTVGGEVPLLMGTAHLASCKASLETEVILVDKDNFWKMLSSCPQVRERILKNMAERSADLYQASGQGEKLFSLGTMAAGLAHELNNPASAMVSNCRKIANVLETSVMTSFSGFCQDPAFLIDLSDTLANFQVSTHLDDFDQEEALENWLIANNIDPSYLVDVFYECGITPAKLEHISKPVKTSEFKGFLQLFSNHLEMRMMCRELRSSAERISFVIATFKDFTYMDTSKDKGLIDVHQSLDTTLALLEIGIIEKDLQVTKYYSSPVITISAYGAQINQAWEQLIKNAIHASPVRGELIIRTGLDDPSQMLIVQIVDQGKGITGAQKKKIFDPFFTTSEVGGGLGMGLSLAHRNITKLHGGSLEAKSYEGKTIFEVRLPID